MLRKSQVGLEFVQGDVRQPEQCRHHGSQARSHCAHSGFGNYFETTHHAPSAFFEDRCSDCAISLSGDVHRGHYLSTHQRAQGFCQSSQLSLDRHWKPRSGLRQQRTIEVPHR